MLMEQKETEIETLTNETDEEKRLHYQHPVIPNKNFYCCFVAGKKQFVGKLRMLVGNGKSHKEHVAVLWHETP
jgi:hypothetical protein